MGDHEVISRMAGAGFYWTSQTSRSADPEERMWYPAQVHEWQLMPPHQVLDDTRASVLAGHLSARAGAMLSADNCPLGWKAQEEVGQLPAKAVPLRLAKPPVQKLGPCRVRCVKGLKTSEQGERERSRLNLHPGEEIESGKRGRRIPDERRQKHWKEIDIIQAHLQFLRYVSSAHQGI